MKQTSNQIMVSDQVRLHIRTQVIDYLGPKVTGPIWAYVWNRVRTQVSNNGLPRIQVKEYLDELDYLNEYGYE